ncbi:hypothetical protein KC711_04055 [Candidatus Peregrinibacteria bacterium]|nr:hypothetical protein [Candidatus Peregrinibacteria bacterium]MCB9805240.1 hypothetical protein [Candidatus Peribacteria bacterium]
MQNILKFTLLMITGLLGITLASSALAYGGIREDIMSTSSKLSDLDGYRLEKLRFLGKTSQSSYQSSTKTLATIRSNIKSTYREGYMTNYEYADIKHEYKYLVSELNSYYVYLLIAERSGSRDMYEEARGQ